jgi:peptidoglycan/xylan/chitin deacetylase (PgdA/CDA1 family)
MFYLANTPFWMRMIFPKNVTWKGDATDNKVYLTFDDGPTPGVTQFVLDQLRTYGYKATFFLIGENVESHPEILKQLRDEGHSVGNHTMHHPNGWQTSTEDYVKEVMDTNELIHSNLFRPPYGKITSSQAERIREELGRRNSELGIRDSELGNTNPEKLNTEFKKNKESKIFKNPTSEIGYPEIKIIMWSVITGDFDTKVDGEICFKRMVQYTKPGSIIVFHDSEKAFPRLQVALPKTLEWIKQNGFKPALIM